MLVIGIFIAIEPRLYDRGFAWMLPIERRASFYDISDHVGFIAAPPDGRPDCSACWSKGSAPG